MTARARSGCQPCRERHLKCDQATPICGRCQSSERECTRGYPYRVYKHKFSDNQKWLRTPADVTFVDETQELVNNYEDESDIENVDVGIAGVVESPHSTSATQVSQSESPHPSWTLVRTPRPLSVSSLVHAESPFIGPLSEHVSLPKLPPLPRDLTQLPSPSSFNVRRQIDGEIPSTGEFVEVNTSFSNQRSPSLPPIYTNKPVWPLTDPAEALLLRHYVQNLAIWLDLCDPMQHFQVEVPRRAGTCPVLLNAIFALAARHLSHVGNYDSFASNRYHQECLKYLIPMLDNTATVSDESLFAASIILRVLEEIDLLETETDLQGHMLGIQVFINARDRSSIPSGLGSAAFWVGLRQEIYVATIKHQAVQINLEHCLVDRSVLPADDFSWANRAVIHCADVLNCCFGNENGVGRKEWEELRGDSERWMGSIPSSFTPIFRREPDKEKGEAFPEIWHSHACHIIGVQHHKLAQILLSIFDPRIPKVGGTRSIAVRSMEAEIKPNLLELCGIGLHNRWTPPGMFTASMGIAICGDRFEDKLSQEALLDILVRTQKDHGRPTVAVQKQMKEAWGWI